MRKKRRNGVKMEFRPCIDIHNGKVKQIVGGSLNDTSDKVQENFVSGQDAAYFADLYRDAGLRGGHIILLNSVESSFYSVTKAEAVRALRAYPGGMQIGGGITPDNAEEFLEAGASHVIVTSYVFREGEIHYERLKKLQKMVGKERLVLDLSCRKTSKGYMIATDRWQKMTNVRVNEKLLAELSEFCDEFLIHAVDVEGRSEGVEEELVRLLGCYEGKPVTYAGGVHSYEDLRLLKQLGKERLNVTVGSALDLFGGPLQWERVLEICSLQAKHP